MHAVQEADQVRVSTNEVGESDDNGVRMLPTVVERCHWMKMMLNFAIGPHL